MRGIRISISVLLIAVSATIKTSSAAYEVINCSPQNLTFDIDSTHKVNLKNLSVYFKYYRNNVGIYQYPGTPSVNLFLNDTEISIKGEIGSNNGGLNINNDKLLSTEVLGIGNIVNVSDHSKGLKDCAFFMLDKSSGSFFNELPLKLDSIIFQLVESCLSAKLCPSLGAVRDNDLARARVSPRDFGPISIWSRTLQISYPNMISPQLPENLQTNKRANLIEAADSIIRMVAEAFYNERNGGIIAIPDIKHRFFTASKGTFTGVQNLMRDENVQVRASPPSNNLQTFTFTFGIPDGYVEYRDYKAVKFNTFRLMPFVGSLCANVQDILFTATIKMDFGQEYCRPSLVDFGTKSPGKAESYTCGSLSMFTNPIMKWFVSAWDTDVVQVVEREIEWMMAAYIHDKFDCENFRLGKKQSS
ncbi:uncharacterized protein LOC100679481 isoform X1 [Nasonia vitripennis]|uniref:Uncharacterized protein n=1 Tax=Nasonia vitripennis TaxID=7425 RepID=A0A7M7LKE6_NASVI|nr:uncharacterized protein LOC100679481 isoform X1 [Nasonia vitripennis]